MADLVLAIDQGTTGTTVLLIDAGGRVRGRAYGELRQYFPHPRWVEYDPEEIFKSALVPAKRTIRAAGAVAANLADELAQLHTSGRLFKLRIRPVQRDELLDGRHNAVSRVLSNRQQSKFISRR